MIKLVGLGLIIPAGWFLYKAITAPPVRLGRAVQQLPLYGILFFMIALSAFALTVGNSFTRVTVAVTGTPDDVLIYEALIMELGREYTFTTLNIYGKPAGNVEAESCNAAALNAFVEKSEKRVHLVFDKRESQKCEAMSAISSFIHPHIDVYLR